MSYEKKKLDLADLSHDCSPSSLNDLYIVKIMSKLHNFVFMTWTQRQSKDTALAGGSSLSFCCGHIVYFSNLLRFLRLLLMAIFTFLLGLVRVRVRV